MTPRETELVGQLQECREALTQARQENALLRQKLDVRLNVNVAAFSAWSRQSF